MKVVHVTIFLLLSLFVSSQTLDTAAILSGFDSLMELNNDLLEEHKLDEAQEALTKAKTDYGEIFGKNSKVYAAIINQLGIVHYYKGELPKVEEYWTEAKDLRKEIFGRNHLAYSGSLNNLAVLYSSLGEFEKAEAMYLEVIEIDEVVLGRDDPDFSYSLNNLAILYFRMGEYDKAESLYLECIEIDARVIGKSHPDYASTLDNLATLYYEMGQFDKLEPLLLEGLAIRKKALGKDHPEYAASLNNLGALYLELRDFDKAEATYLESLAIKEKSKGKEHLDYAYSVINLATVYSQMGQYEKAEPMYLQSIEIRKNALGTDHPDYASALYNLAGLYVQMNQYEKAVPLYLEAKSIREKKLGIHHPDYAVSLDHLASVYFKMGENTKAQPFYIETSKLNQDLILRAQRHLSEQEMNQYLLKFVASQNKIYSFTELRSDEEEMTRTSFNNSLFYKGYLLNAANRIKRLAFSDSLTTEKFNLLKSYGSDLATEYSLPLYEQDSAKLEDLTRKANTIEKELAKAVSGFGEAIRQVDWDMVKNQLSSDEAAIEFVHYQYYNPGITDTIKYAALLIRPGYTQPMFIPLFEEGALNSLLATKQARRSDYVNDLYSFEDRGAMTTNESKATLYDLIWQPLDDKLEGISKIYFAPSGLLHRVNIGAISQNEDEIISDRFHLVQVNSTRQLAVDDTTTSSIKDALLFGGVNYNLDTMQVQSELAYNETVPTRGVTETLEIDSAMRGDSWNYLKYTEKEVVAIERILSSKDVQVTTHTGFGATEEKIRRDNQDKTSPSIIHLATHGFFFPDPKNQKESGDNEPVFKTSDNAMMRSGLLLAGGNHTWQGNEPVQGLEDGILTAYEISQMDLSNTELVVLSACETGLGKIQGNEGVYGLQRAFKIAGAKYLIMSLWQVPDRQTMEFMKSFYKHWLEGETTIPEAFRMTQSKMRDRFYDPYAWAGFVLVE